MLDVVSSGLQADATTLQFRDQVGRESSYFWREYHVSPYYGSDSSTHVLCCFQVVVLHKVVRLEMKKIRMKLTKVDLRFHFLYKIQHMKAPPSLQQQQQQLCYLV